MGEAALEQHTVLSQLSVSRKGREGGGEGGEGTRGKGREEEGRGQEGRGGRKRGGDERGGEERDKRGEGNHKCTYVQLNTYYLRSHEGAKYSGPK